MVGDNELAQKQGRLKDMASGAEEPIALDDSLYTTLYKNRWTGSSPGMADLFGEELADGLEK